MKTIQKQLTLLFIVLLTMLGSSCKTVNIKTILGSDASIVRQISVSGDSSGADETAYPFPQNGSWLMSRKRDDNDSTKYTYLISNNFSNIDELNAELDYRADSIKINAISQMDKKFRWFYTYYHYEESFFSFFPFRDLPLKNYVHEDELELYSSGVDSIDIEDKLEQYAQDNFSHVYLTIILDILTKQGATDINAEQWDQCKLSVLSMISDWSFESDELTMEILAACDSILQPAKPLVSMQQDFADIDSTVNEYLALLEKLIGEDYQAQIVMPGRIYDTNANNSLTRRTAVWQFESEKFHFVDYTMWVDSRRLNIVPTAISLLILFVGLFLLYLSSQGKKRRLLEERGIAWEDRKRFILKWPISLLCILLGVGLIGFFSWIFLVFNTEPLIAWLHFFNASPTDNALFISLMVLGLILIVTGMWHLILARKEKSRLLRKSSQAEPV
jgi:hypothetical protein